MGFPSHSHIGLSSIQLRWGFFLFRYLNLLMTMIFWVLATQVFLISPILGEVIKLDEDIFFKWVGSTTIASKLQNSVQEIDRGFSIFWLCHELVPWAERFLDQNTRFFCCLHQFLLGAGHPKLNLTWASVTYVRVGCLGVGFDLRLVFEKMKNKNIKINQDHFWKDRSDHWDPIFLMFLQFLPDILAMYPPGCWLVESELV